MKNVKNVKHVKHVMFVVANGRQQEILLFYLDEVCASFMLLLVVQILHTDSHRSKMRHTSTWELSSTVWGPSR